MVDQRLLEILVCPWCLGALKHEADRLACVKCRAGYSIVDDIPNMLVEEADLRCVHCDAGLKVESGTATCPECGKSWPVGERRTDL